MVRLIPLIFLLLASTWSSAQEELLLKEGYHIDSLPEKLTITYYDRNLAESPIGVCEAEDGKVTKFQPTDTDVRVDLPAKPKAEYMVLTLDGDGIYSGDEKIDLQEAQDRIIRYSQVLRLSNSRGLVVFHPKEGASMLPMLELLLTTSRTERLAIRLGEDATVYAELQSSDS